MRIQSDDNLFHFRVLFPWVGHRRQLAIGWTPRVIMQKPIPRAPSALKHPYAITYLITVFYISRFFALLQVLLMNNRVSKRSHQACENCR